MEMSSLGECSGWEAGGVGETPHENFTLRLDLQGVFVGVGVNGGILEANGKETKRNGREG